MRREAVTIIGLGPGDPGLITQKAWRVLGEAEEVYFRTLLLPGMDQLPPNFKRISFDEIYETLDDYSEIYQRILDRLIDLAHRPQGVVYAVPGDPMVGEATVQRLLARAADEELEASLIHGVSFIEPCLAALQLDALEGLVVADALALAAGFHPPFSLDQPAFISQIHARALATDVKLTLMNQYPDEHEVALITGVTGPRQRVDRIPLHQLDHDRGADAGFDGLTTLFVPPVPEASSFEALQGTVARLRAPDGCPWDREQTHLSLRNHLMEEAYEALSALDTEDMEALREELGDLLLQIVLQAQIATESGEFKMGEVIASINSKLRRRHPHVFADVEVEGVDQVLRNWEHLKEAERDHEGKGGSLLDGVPRALPALAQAAELQQRASRVGFDWPSVDGVLAKVAEEIQEIVHAEAPQRKASELGDLLFAMVNYARWIGADPEAELRGANLRFRRRFHRMSELARGQGLKLEEMTLEQMDELWDLAKGTDL